MEPPGSVSVWIGQLQAGDAAAAQALWERYFRRLVGLAAQRLRGQPKRAADEEDVALSAFDSFCRAAAAGRFPRLQDQHDLWRLLVTITERKAVALLRREHRQKRGGGAVLDEDACGPPGAFEVADPGPTPEFAAQVADQCRRLLEALGVGELRSIAIWKMEGDSTEVIAKRLGRAPRTVERKLRLIREIWEQEGLT